jgi:hypothetical protein
MADYLAPFNMPEFTDAEYEKKKAEYVAANGYTVTYPRFSDIIHFSAPKPMTDQEMIWWYDKKKDWIPEDRRIELYAQQEKSRDRYNNMLSSPVPNWVVNYTAVLTTWDNMQDLAISMAAIGRIALKFLPSCLGRFLIGPIGWLWLIAEAMNVIISPSMCLLNPMKCKRDAEAKMKRRAKALKAKHKPPESWTRAWAEIQKEKFKHGFKGYAKSGGFMPSFSEVIQMAQVTKDIWGIGLSIGPLFGIAYDFMFGGVRWLRGQDVTFELAPSDLEIYERAEDKDHLYGRWKRPHDTMTESEFLTWKNEMVATGTWGIQSKQDEECLHTLRLAQMHFGWMHRDETALYCTAEIACQGVLNVLNYWNPMENIKGLEHIEIEATHYPDPLVEEMLRQEGKDPNEGIAWPQLGKRWATYEEIQTSLAPIAASNFENFYTNCPSDDLKAIGEFSAIEFGLHSVQLLEG